MDDGVKLTNQCQIQMSIGMKYVDVIYDADVTHLILVGVWQYDNDATH